MEKCILRRIENAILDIVFPNAEQKRKSCIKYGYNLPLMKWLTKLSLHISLPAC